MPPSTIQETTLISVTRAADDLLRTAEAVPVERRLWRPGGVAQHVVHILAHCGATNRFYAAVIAGELLPYRTQDERDEAIADCDTFPKATAFLNTSVDRLRASIEALSPEQAGQPMVMPWGERLPAALGLMAPVEHMRYHEGQINLIQMLLGDDEYH